MAGGSEKVINQGITKKDGEGIYGKLLPLHPVMGLRLIDHCFYQSGRKVGLNWEENEDKVESTRTNWNP